MQVKDASSDSGCQEYQSSHMIRRCIISVVRSRPVWYLAGSQTSGAQHIYSTSSLGIMGFIPIVSAFRSHFGSLSGRTAALSEVSNDVDPALTVEVRLRGVVSFPGNYIYYVFSMPQFCS